MGPGEKSAMGRPNSASRRGEHFQKVGLARRKMLRPLACMVILLRGTEGDGQSKGPVALPTRDLSIR